MKKISMIVMCLFLVFSLFANGERETAAGLDAGTHVLNVDGYEVLLYVPESAPDRNVPLVVNLHPSSGTGEKTLEESKHVADKNGFALLAPTGVAGELADGWQWNVPGVPLFKGLPIVNDRDDVVFIEHTIDAAAGKMSIDLSRVYAIGFSGGARMVSQLACDLSDRLAAVVMISGIRFPLASDAALGLPDSKDCSPVRSIPVIAIHGFLDSVNVWGEVPPVVDPPPAWKINPPKPGSAWSYAGETAVKRWIDFNSCSETPTVIAITDNIDLIEYRSVYYKDADVTVVMVKNAGHTVPGYPNHWLPGHENMEIDGYELAWNLLSKYKLPDKYVDQCRKK